MNGAGPPVRHPAIVLASGSPRRRELLGSLGLPFTVDPPVIDEDPVEGEDPVAYVTRLATAKVAAVSGRHPFELLIAADTTVDIDGRIMGKPVDAPDAVRMLRLLSGRDHRVHTGLAVALADRVEVAMDTTLVRMAVMSDVEVGWYVATGEPLDKAGAYAIQGAGGVFVESVVGSVSNVIGLPMTLLRSLARRLGVELMGSHHDQL